MKTYKYEFGEIDEDAFGDLKYIAKRVLSKNFRLSHHRKTNTLTIKPPKDYLWEEIDFHELVGFLYSHGLGLKREEPYLQNADFTNFREGISNLYAVERKQEFQYPYIPTSNAPAIGTLISSGLKDSTARAMQVLQEEVGDIDDYVAATLGYNKELLYSCFSGEQVDALALAIWNINKGKSLVLGDQTGLGKGRVLAGIIRYALAQRLTPIFVTDNEKLYADIMRDIADIGMGDFRPLMTNRQAKIPLMDGECLESPSDLESRLKNLNLNGYDGIFTTYYQLSTIKGKRQSRHEFLEHFARGAVVILDESHQAGGKANVDLFSSRGLFARSLAELARGVVYSSATFAKTPESLAFYTRSDMVYAMSEPEELVGIMTSGGIPLQQSVAADLAAAGQYLRRERSYEGIDFTPFVVSVDHEIAERFSYILSQIMAFDSYKQAAAANWDVVLRKEAASISLDNSTGEAGASSTNFTAIAHNLIDQFLLAVKADATVEVVKDAIARDKKPVIALANTMGSAIEKYVKEQNLAPGDIVDLNFGQLIKNYLYRTRIIFKKDYAGDITRHYLEDSELEESGVKLFNRIVKDIEDTDFTTVPVSPIDYITHKLEQAGIKVSEITGRAHTIKYGDEHQYYQLRTSKQRSKAESVKIVTAFNDGELDVVIINRSGSTGISMHASSKFKDQRQRTMILAQSEKDINVFMQTLGRIHRTGQTSLPSFLLLMSDLPAEKRPGAILCKKLASLNANTTAHRQSAGIQLGTLDFMNELGDIAAYELMRSQPLIHGMLGDPLRDFEFVEAALSKVTGRIPMLPSLEQQEMLYEMIEEQYQSILESRGGVEGSGLEANFLPGVVLTPEEEVLSPLSRYSKSPFLGDVRSLIFEVRINRSPYPKKKVLKLLGAKDPQEAVTQGLQTVADYKVQLNQEIDSYIQNVKSTENLQQQQRLIEGLLDKLVPGSTVEIVDGEDRVWHGVVGKITAKKAFGKQLINPAAPSRWLVKFYIATPMREMTFNFYKLLEDQGVKIRPATKNWRGIDIWEAFDTNQGEYRERRTLLCGNLLFAYRKLGGKIVKYDHEDKIKYALMLPLGVDVKRELKSQPAKFNRVEQVWSFLSNATNFTGKVTSQDKDLTITSQPNWEDNQGLRLILETPKSRRTGGKYYLHQPLLDAMDAQFFSSGNNMKAVVTPANSKKTLEVLLQLGVIAKNHVDLANKMINEDESSTEV